MARGPRAGRRAPPRYALGPAPALGHPLPSLRATDAIVRAHPQRRRFEVHVQAADSVHDAWEMWRLLAPQQSKRDWYIHNLDLLEAVADLRFPIDEARDAFAELLDRVSGVDTGIELNDAHGLGGGGGHGLGAGGGGHADGAGRGHGLGAGGGGHADGAGRGHGLGAGGGGHADGAGRGHGIGALVRGGHAVQGGPVRDGYVLAYSFMLYPGDTGAVDPYGLLVTIEYAEQVLQDTTCSVLRERAAGLAGYMRGARRTVERFDRVRRRARFSSHSRRRTLEDMQASVASVRERQEITLTSLRRVLRQIASFAQRRIFF